MADPYAPGGKPTAYKNTSTTQSDMTVRRISAIALALLLYTAAMPFYPVSFFLPVPSSGLIDALCAGVALLSACYFQWRISGLTSALAIILPTGQTTMRNGRIERTGDFGFIWSPAHYWSAAALEGVLLFLALATYSEGLRLGLVLTVIAALWLVGWHATPHSTKVWAWGQIKSFWFWTILGEVLNGGQRSYGRGRLGARRYYY